MANLAENHTSGPVLGVPQGSDARQYVLTGGRLLMGTSGAVSTSSVTPAGFTVSKPAGTGLYRIAHPQTMRGRLVATYYNAAGNNTLGVTGDSHTLGSTAYAQLQVYTLSNGTAANGTETDYIDWLFLGER